MDTSKLAEELRHKYRREIAAFREELFGPDGTFSAATEVGERKIPRIGPVPSTADRFSKLTIIADLTDLSYLESESAPGEVKPGERTVVTVSLAGHHRVMNSRTSVDEQEAISWVRAVLGDEWATGSYRQGMLTGTGPTARTLYFRVFLNEDYKVCQAPPTFSGPELEPVNIPT